MDPPFATAVLFGGLFGATTSHPCLRNLLLWSLRDSVVRPS
jgi:hypothetical protein